MLVTRNLLVLWLVMLASSAIAAQRTVDDPYQAYDCAGQMIRQSKTGAIKKFIDAPPQVSDVPCVSSLLLRRYVVEDKSSCAMEPVGPQGQPRQECGDWLLFVAELMKGVGDYRASSRYDRAVKADEWEAAYSFFFGEYLRNFRGPNEPLYPAAERRYNQCGKILDQVAATPTMSAPHDAETRSRLARSLVALHQRDGIPLATRAFQAPVVSFASVFRAAQSNADLDRTSDIRDYTSAAAFAGSRARKGFPLTLGEYRSLIRVETPIETFNRVRFRAGEMPVFDLFYDYRHTSNVAPEVYRPPFTFVPLQLNNWGVGASKPFSIGSVDMSLAGSFQQSWRQGLIEYLPDAIERINQYQGSADLARFVGRDKLNISMLYAFQTIVPDAPGAPNRERRFFAPSASYDFYRSSTFSEHFENRGIGVFGGALYDRETYPVPAGVRTPDTLVWRKDYYFGLSARGLAGGRWDFTVQPTFFSSTVKPDDTQNNSQYRTNLVVLFRIVDEEKSPGLPHRRPGTHLGFLHLVFPLRQDIGRSGIDVYRNYKAGAELDAMWYNSRRGGVTFLGSVRYDFQRFYFLNVNQNLVTVGLSMGF